MKKLTTEEFVTRAKIVHGTKYNYDECVYKSAKIKVKIKCHIHGLFEQTPSDHLSKCGCPKCGKLNIAFSQRGTTDDFITKAQSVHGDKYDYSKVEYVNAKSNVDIICKEHGLFSQTPDNHIQGRGCPRCKFIKLGNIKRSTTDDFITKAKLVHGDKYDYSVSEYVNSKNKIKVICPIHGVFEQNPSDHLYRYGCSKCGRDITASIFSMGKEEFIRRAINVHGDKYDYSKVNYTNANSKVTIICPIHGDFEQVAASHLYSGCGCISCSIRQSKPELEISEFLDGLGVSYIHGDRDILKPLELDFYIPDHNIAIEFNGLNWHSEQFGKDKWYHYNKTKVCAEKGIRLIHLWEDDWNKNKELQLSFIKTILGKSDDKRIPARKCVTKFIDKNDAKQFLDKYHIQGSVNHSVAIGLYHSDILVSVTCFTVRDNGYELVRHACSTPVIGSLGKSVKFMVKHYDSLIYTFCDNSRFIGDSYLKAGFVVKELLDPDYKYVINNKREHKFLWRRKSIQNKLPEFYSEDLTEYQMMVNAGYYRVWDCGKTKYVYTS